MNVYYQALQINVSMSGNYTIVSNSSMDTYGYLYNDSFNPLFPPENLLLQDDDDGGNRQFKLVSFFRSLATYIIVVTTYDGGITGGFSIIATGPAVLGFSQINITSKNP
jgi:hypothetical protein